MTPASNGAGIGPTGTLAHLAALRGRTTDPATLAALDTAMTRQRDFVAATAERAEQPPPWAHALLARSTWTGQPGRSQQEREVIAKVAVYRDRFDVRGDGLGAQPAARDEQRIWRGLRNRLVALRRDDDRDQWSGPRQVSTRVAWWRCGGHAGVPRAVLRGGSAALERAAAAGRCGAAAEMLGRGGKTVVATASGMSRNTVIKAVGEVVAGIEPSERLRAVGGGDKALIDKQPGLLAALDDLVHPVGVLS